MALLHMTPRLALSLIFIVLSSNIAWCGDREELLLVAEDIRNAIERQDPEGILKHVHDTVFIDPDSFTPDELRQAFKDSKSWPNEVLFFGEYSVHSFSTGKTDIYIQENPHIKKPGFWQISLENPESKTPILAFIFVAKHSAGWTVTDIIFY